MEKKVTYIGHQHHNTPECHVGDWYLMLVPNSGCWWCVTNVQILSPTHLVSGFLAQGLLSRMNLKSSPRSSYHQGGQLLSNNGASNHIYILLVLFVSVRLLHLKFPQMDQKWPHILPVQCCMKCRRNYLESTFILYK